MKKYLNSIHFKLMSMSMAVVIITVLILAGAVTYRENISFKQTAKHATEFIAETIGERILSLIMVNQYQEAGKIVEAILQKENRILAIRVREKTPIGLMNVLYAKSNDFNESFFDSPVGFSKKFYHYNYILKLGKEEKGDIQIFYSLNEMYHNIKKFNLLVCGILVICIIIAFFISTVLSNIIVNPLKSFTESAKKIASGNLNEIISINNKDEIGELAKSFEIMRQEIKNHIEKLDKKVLERTQAITDLLDNAGQGFLSFGKSLIVFKEYSKQCIDIFERKIEDLNILEVLFPKEWKIYKTNPSNLSSESYLIIANEVFNTVFNDGNEILFKVLPEELEYNSKILNIKYALLNKDMPEKKIMLIVTDITAEKKLAEQAKFEIMRNKLIVKVALDKKTFIEFIRDLNGTLKYLQQLVNNENMNMEFIKEIFRIVHTIKGNASFFNLGTVVDKSHTMEDYLSEITETGNISEERIEKIKTMLDEIIIALNENLDLISNFLSKDEIFKDDKIFEVTESQLNNVINFIINKNISETEKKIIVTHIKELKKFSIKFILKRFALNAEQMARNMHKKIEPIEINNIDLQVDYYYLKPAVDTFVHLIRNAVDHGIEFPNERKKNNKAAAGKIRIFLDEKLINNKTFFIFKISDDGKGIDIQKLKDVLIKKNIISEQEIKKFTDKEILNFIFDDGISTKDNVSNISGRGVGLSAVKNGIQKLNGKIEVESELNKGTTITIYIPYL